MRDKKDMLNLENEAMPSRKWWKQARSEIQAEKEKFIKSGKLGGNPLGLPNDTLKKDLKI